MTKTEVLEKKSIIAEQINVLNEILKSESNASVVNDSAVNLTDAEEVIMLERAIKEFEMKKKIIKVKQIHEYPVHHTESSGWFTVVDDSSKPDGKRKIRKSTEEKLWLALADWYLDKIINAPTLIDVFEKWIAWKETPRNHSNIERIKISWNSYYFKEPLSQDLINKPMSQITVLELRTWAENLMKKHFPVLSEIVSY